MKDRIRIVEILILVATIAVAFAAIGRAQTYPGFWTCGNPGNTLERCPCYWNPYTEWTDPKNGHTGYVDFASNRAAWPSTCPAGGSAPCLYSTSGGGGNHSLMWLDVDGFSKPMSPQPFVPNYYPAPTAGTALCPEWTAAGNTSACPGSSNYVNAIKQGDQWRSGYAYWKPKMDADPGCNSSLPTVTPQRTATPAATPTPTASIFQDWIYEFVKEGYSAGCGVGKYCPGDSQQTQSGLMTRAQYAVFGLKQAHGPDYTPPPCTPPGELSDVPCIR